MKVVAHLSNPAKVLEDTAKYINVAKEKKGAADKTVTEIVAKDTILTRSTTVEQKTPKGPCGQNRH